MPANKRISRRSCLAKLMVLTAATGVLPELASSNPAKASKSLVHYRDFPKQMQMCGMCKFFERGGMMGAARMGQRAMMCGGMMGHGMMAGECEVVEGRISPMGWCDLYAPRG
jgi:hypothetical protein